MYARHPVKNASSLVQVIQLISGAGTIRQLVQLRSTCYCVFLVAILGCGQTQEPVELAPVDTDEEYHQLIRAVLGDDLQLLGRLIDRNPALANRSEEPTNRTALITAAEMSSVESIHFLIEHGADPGITDGLQGWAALHHAAERSRPAQVEALILAGADVNQLSVHPDPNYQEPGITPLDLAAAVGAIECVKILLEHGAKLDGNPPESSRSALHYAVMGRYIQHDEALRQNYKTLQRMYAEGTRTDPPIPGISSGNRDVIIELLVHGASLSDRDYLGDQPIHRCAQYGAVDTLTFLLENYADQIDVNSPGSFGRTPLQIVAGGVLPGPRQGDLTAKVIRLLLDHGADPLLTTDQWRKTPYKIALESQHHPGGVSENVLRLLRSTEVSPDATPTNAVDKSSHSFP